jgi:hypothetical protein
MNSTFNAHPALLETIRTYTALSDCGHECVRLWLWLRSQDVEGSGKVCITPREISRRMCVALSTVYRWLANSVWFRGRDRATQSIYYTSIAKVCVYLGISHLGTISRVSLLHLSRSANKLTATQLDAQQGQRRARYKIRNMKRMHRPRKLEPFGTSETSTGGTARTFRYFVVPQRYTVPVVSTETIANQSRYSTQTIRKRLRNSTRTGKGLPQLKRVRLLIPAPPEVTFAMGQAGKSFASVGDRVYKVMMSDGKAYRLGCNHYEENFVLESCRFLRSRIKHAVDRRDAFSDLSDTSEQSRTFDSPGT